MRIFTHRNYNDKQNIYVYGEDIPPHSCQIEDTRFRSANEAILAALHLYAEQQKQLKD